MCLWLWAKFNISKQRAEDNVRSLLCHCCCYANVMQRPRFLRTAAFVSELQHVCCVRGCPCTRPFGIIIQGLQLPIPVADTFTEWTGRSDVIRAWKTTGDGKQLQEPLCSCFFFFILFNVLNEWLNVSKNWEAMWGLVMMVNDGLILAVCKPAINLEAVRFAIFYVVEESQSGVSDS